MRPVVWIGVVCVHILDGSKNSVRVECVVVLPDVVLHHRVEELPADVVRWGQALVVVCKKVIIENCQMSNFYYRLRAKRLRAKRVASQQI